MGAVLMIARAEVRRRWRALLALGLLAALVGAVVLGALVGARRTGTAFDRLIARTGYWDVEVEIYDPAVANDIAALPQVETSWLLDVDIGELLGVDEVVYMGFTSGSERSPEHYRPLVVEGRMFDAGAEDEIVVSEYAARVFHWEIGRRLDFAGLSREQFAGFQTGEVPGPPEGARTELTITGYIRDPNDALPFELPRIMATPAYHRDVAPDVGGLGLLTVRLERGAADLGAFRADLASMVGEDQAKLSPISVHDLRGGVDKAASVAVRALLAFAAVAALAGLVALAQALSRSLLLRGAELEVHRAVGLGQRDRVIVLVLPLALVVSIAAVGSVLGAFAASPLTPVGVGRSIEPDGGFDFNVALLAMGGAAVAVCTFALCVGVAIKQLRLSVGRVGAPARASGLVRQAVASGAPMPLVMGTRFAMDPGRGRAALPTRSALIGAVVGVSGVVAAAAVLASLDRVSASPARYGWNHDATVSDVDEEALAALVENDDFAAVTAVQHGEIAVAGAAVDAIVRESHKGRIDETVLAGRMPSGVGEVALGPVLVDELGAGEGDTIEALGADGEQQPLRVVGIVLTEGPALYASRAVLDADAGEQLELGGDVFVEAYVEVAADADDGAVIAELAARKEISVPEQPAELLNLEQARGLIRLLAAFMGLLGIAAVGHALLLTTRRRRHELAVLRAVGFTGRQLGVSIRSMAAVLFAVGLLIGVPVGVIAGSVTWAAMADAIYLPTEVAVPVAWLGFLVVAAVVASGVLSALPARSAAKIAPATTLRTE